MKQLSFRPIGPEDMEFLARLYRSTREDELAMLADWTEEQKDAFLRQQFQAQHAYYHEHYVGAEFLLILLDEQPAGRLYIHRRPEEIRLMDIALLPEHRNDGLGTKLVRDLLAEGEASGKPVTIHVEIYNPAMRLYQRLGFKPIADRGVYHLLEWRPESASS
jgi:GNAT superfamily N-acetyltransferase